MSNILQFALGLNPGNFLSNATKAAGALTGIIGAGLGVSAAISKLGQQIERGARLEDLANRTGVAVGALNGLQRGFGAVGVEGDAFLGVIAGLQRSLGGFNELGEPTKNIFAGIGLSVDDLKKKDLPGAMEAIFGKLAGLDASTATNFAAKIFGKGAGGDALQAARNVDEFAGAVQRARRESELLGQHSGSLNALGNSWSAFKRQVDSAALGMATGVVPSLRAISDSLNGVDVEGFGHRLGNVFLGLGESIRQSRFQEVLTLAMRAAAHDGVEFLITSLKAVPSALGSAAKEGLISQNPVMRVARRSLVGLIPGGIGTTINRAQFGFDSGRLLGDPVLRGLTGKRNLDREKLNALLDKLKLDGEKRIKDETGKPAPAPAPAAPGKPADPAKPSENLAAPQVNADALTRIGFFSGGGGSASGAALNALKETSRQSLEQLRTLNAFIARKPHLFNDGGLVNQ